MARILELEWPKFNNTHVYAHIFRSDTRQDFVFTFTYSRFSRDEGHL